MRHDLFILSGSKAMYLEVASRIILYAVCFVLILDYTLCLFTFTDDSTPSHINRLERQNELKHKIYNLTYTKAYLIQKFIPTAKIFITLRDPTIR